MTFIDYYKILGIEKKATAGDIKSAYRKLEGIETITYLLQRIEILQNEIIKLKNRLHFYDTQGQD